jgi:hypothetical protein
MAGETAIAVNARKLAASLPEPVHRPIACIGLRAALATLIRLVWGRCAYLSLGGALAAILLASGCGGGESAPVTGVSGASGANGSTALTKSGFVKQADAICAEANSAIDSLSVGATTGDESLQASQGLEITRSELQSLQALRPPDEDHSTLNDFLAALKDEVDALTRLNSAVAAGGDTSAADSEVASARANAEQAATEYGMKDCGNAKSTTQPGVTTAVPTTTTAVPTTPTTTTTATPTTTTPTTTTPPAPPSGGTGGAPSGGTGGGTGGSGGGTGSGGTGGSGGISP